MIYLAFSIGFFGSLHCIGMCGPLALGVSSFYPQDRLTLMLRMLSYNIGRILTYALMGLVLGAIGQSFVLTGFQKSLSIVSGIVLVILFLFSLDLEKLFNKFEWYKKALKKYHNWFSNGMSHFKSIPSFLLGAMNGLLPCGLVYLALLGAMTAGNIEKGALFMLIFGMGTIPAMLLTVILGREILQWKRLSINRLLPVLQLCLGIYLIYRGIVVDMPQELDFYSLLAQPVRCH
jgi:sulfite exporter TauE/SafE